MVNLCSTLASAFHKLTKIISLLNKIIFLKLLLSFYLLQCLKLQNHLVLSYYQNGL